MTPAGAVDDLSERYAAACEQVRATIAGQAGAWDRAGAVPHEVIRSLSDRGLLTPDLPTGQGGLGLTGALSGEYTALVGSLCGSIRSLMTAHGMATWAIRRFGTAAQRDTPLSNLRYGLGAVAFTEEAAGSDLSAMTTTIRPDDDAVVVDGRKLWVTGAAYAGTVAVFGRYGAGGAIALVDLDRPGVHVEPVRDVLGCRAAGHAHLRLHRVRVPASAVLGGAGLPVGMLVSAVLTHGRLSVAWGCVGMLRACLSAVTAHARTRVQFGRPLAGHQLVARHLAELFTAEQAATHTCAHASRCWEQGTPEAVTAAVVAKLFAARAAARGAATAVQVLASAGVHDGHPVSRAYRDAKLMEIIEGSTEISQLLLAEHATRVWSGDERS
jgi:methoxymalonate biosynthesis protein